MLNKKNNYLLFGVFFIASSFFLTANAQYKGGVGSGYASAESDPNIPLPVELVSFQATVFEKKIQLTWKTESEVSNYGFEIERAAYSNEPYWKKIGFVEGYGNSNSPKNYSFEDQIPIVSNRFYYRLKQLDTDGEFTFSDRIEVVLEINEVSLYQNYPNPFNPSTIIAFNLNEQTFVKLDIYNLLGEKVASILNESLNLGYHEIEFNGVNLPSGIYIYKLEAGGFLESKIMSLLK